MSTDFSDNQKVLIEDGLYTEYDLSSISDGDFEKMVRTGSVDAYCPDCKCKSVFRIKGPEIYPFKEEAQKLPKFGLVTAHGVCVRQAPDKPLGKCEHDLYVLFYRSLHELTKIGQFPSKADMDFGILDEAHKELSADFRKELGTAIGLFSHGVGIGAFVYLRRIFEQLVEEARVSAVAARAIDEHDFSQARMVDKIKLLSGYLPSRLVNSANMYGVLSKGIHELSEEECKEKFGLVRQAIHLILSQRHEEKEYAKIAGTIR